jgi:hypothetical protein
MRRTRAVQHVEGQAQSCAEMALKLASLFPLRVTQLWAVGDLHETPHDLDPVRVALPCAWTCPSTRAHGGASRTARASLEPPHCSQRDTRKLMRRVPARGLRALA